MLFYLHSKDPLFMVVADDDDHDDEQWLLDMCYLLWYVSSSAYAYVGVPIICK